MKIVTWNANMAFRNKKHRLLEHDPDILVIQECERPDHAGTWNEFEDYEWVGENKNKGIGIYTRNGYTLDRIHEDVPARYFLPVSIPEVPPVTLLNVWAMNNTEQREKRYIGQLWTALQHYDFVDEKTVIAGDINWNVRWDSSPAYGLVADYTDVINELDNYGLCSAYHELTGEDYGEESEPTFFMRRKEDKPFHTDHVFLPRSLVDAVTEFDVGSYEEWAEYSDHVPLFLEVSTE